MMNYGYMMGSDGGTFTLLAWIPYILTVALLALGVVALLKYIGKK